MKSFLEWLKNRDRSLFESRQRYRPELTGQSVNRFAVNVNDIIEMGPETQERGKSVNRLAQVVRISGGMVEARDLTTPSQDIRIMVPIDHLYNKEDLLGRTLFPADERYLKQLGAEKLWVKLTPRQYRKFKSQYRAEEMPSMVPSSHSQDDKASEILKQLFSGNDEPQQEEPRMTLFDPTEKSKKPTIRKGSSLSSYISRKKQELDDQKSSEL